MDGILMRFGASYISVPKEQDIAACTRQLRSALESDPRVQWIKGGEPNEQWDEAFRYYPSPASSYEATLLGSAS